MQKHVFVDYDFYAHGMCSLTTCSYVRDMCFNDLYRCTRHAFFDYDLHLHMSFFYFGLYVQKMSSLIVIFQTNNMRSLISISMPSVCVFGYFFYARGFFITTAHFIRLPFLNFLCYQHVFFGYDLNVQNTYSYIMVSLNTTFIL